MGLAVATITTEARAHNRVLVKGWVALRTNFSHQAFTPTTLWARAHDMSRAGLMVKSLRALPTGSIVYIHSQKLHFLAGWARVRHCTRAGWMCRIGLEFRKPLFTDLGNWTDGSAGIAGAATSERPLLQILPEYCAAPAEESNTEARASVSADAHPEASAPPAGGNVQDLKKVAKRKKFAPAKSKRSAARPRQVRVKRRAS